MHAYLQIKGYREKTVIKPTILIYYRHPTYQRVKFKDKCYVERVVIELTILTCGGDFPEQSNSMIKVYRDTIILPLSIRGDTVL